MKKIQFLIVVAMVLIGQTSYAQCKEVNKANLQLRKGYPDEAIQYLKEADSLFTTLTEPIDDEKCIANHSLVYAASYLKKAVEEPVFANKLLFTKKSDEYFQKFYKIQDIPKAIKIDGDAQFEQLGIMLKNVAVDAYSENKMQTAYELNLRSIEVFEIINPKKIDNALKFNTAICAMAVEKYNEALPYLDEIIAAKYEARLATAYRLKSEAQLKLKMTKEAQATLDSAMVQFPEDNNLKLQALNLMMDAGENEKALETVTKILETEQKRADLYVVQAQLYYDQNEAEKAKEAYEKAREVEPNNEYALYGIGVYYVQQANQLVEDLNNAEGEEKEALKKQLDARYEKAIYFLEQALSVNPKDRSTLTTLVRLYRSMGNEDKAQEYEVKL